MTAKLVTDWALTFARGQEYTAPEARVLALVGIWPDGKKRESSPIVNFLGPKSLRTETGSVYEVSGPPNQAYADFMKKRGTPIDLDNPLGRRAG